MGPDHPQVALGLNNLADLLTAQNKIDEAEPLFRRALEIWETQLGENHPHVASGLFNIASLLKKQNKLDEAREIRDSALPLARRVLGPRHQVTQNLSAPKFFEPSYWDG